MKLSEAFAILGVPSTADPKEIKAAYRKRVNETHPDKGGDAREFIKVRAAYEIICSFLESPDIDNEVPIPDDLRAVVDEIVREFRSQFEKCETLCADRFSDFNDKMRGHLASGASRDQLREFGQHFRTEWNNLVINLFAHFNRNCRSTIHKYEKWFDNTLEETFEDIYERELKAFSSSRRFRLYGFILLGLGTLLAVIAYGLGSSIHFSILLGALPLLGLLPFVYRLEWSVRPRRKCPADVQTLSVQLFEIDPNKEFQGSATLKQSSVFTAAAGWGGLAIGDLIGGGHPIIGAIVGLVAGEIYGRIKNPTEKMRQMILEEFNRFVSVAEPEVTKYVIESHQKLMQDLQKEILASYQEGVKRTVLLLTSASSPRPTPFEQSHQKEFHPIGVAASLLVLSFVVIGLVAFYGNKEVTTPQPGVIETQQTDYRPVQSNIVPPEPAVQRTFHVNDLNKNEMLIKAASQGNFGAVREICSMNPNVDYRDEDGATALIVASWSGYREVVEFLVKQGANVNLRTHSGHTALARACLNGHEQIVKLLVEKGADVNAATKHGGTPLLFAREKPSIASLLKAHGAKE